MTAQLFVVPVTHSSVCDSCYSKIHSSAVLRKKVIFLNQKERKELTWHLLILNPSMLKPGATVDLWIARITDRRVSNRNYKQLCSHLCNHPQQVISSHLRRSRSHHKAGLVACLALGRKEGKPTRNQFGICRSRAPLIQSEEDTFDYGMSYKRWLPKASHAYRTGNFEIHQMLVTHLTVIEISISRNVSVKKRVNKTNLSSYVVRIIYGLTRVTCTVRRSLSQSLSRKYNERRRIEEIRPQKAAEQRRDREPLFELSAQWVWNSRNTNY